MSYQDLLENIEYERLKDIQKLEKDVVDIYELNNEVAELVLNNGEKIDTIENNIIETSNIIIKGNNDLKKTLIISDKYLPLKFGFISGIIGVSTLGPIGMIAGVKVGSSVALGLGGGTLSGTIGGIIGKKLKKKRFNKLKDNE